MAVKASATITLTSYRDTQSVTRYYKLQTAGSSAPLKPNTKPPSSDWTDSEPACDISKELYFCDLTIFSNGDGEYSKVSKSSSYEAAKQAFNRAQAAKDSIDNLEIGGRNLALSNNDNSNKIGSSSDMQTVTFSGWSIASEISPNITVDANEEYIGRCYIECVSCSVEGATVGLGIQGLKDGSYNTQTIVGTIGVGESALIEVHHITKVDENSISLQIRNNNSTNTATVNYRFLKLEKGNKATDWTPAPEDVDAGISEAQGNALTAQEEANALDEDLIDFKSNEYSQINDKVGELVEYKGENEKEIGKIREELSQELVAQRCARIEPDKGSLILGEINGTTAVLTNEQFGFYTPNSEIAAAYFGKDNDAWAFNIERGIIKNDLRFSGFQWIARSNKNMSLKWIK